MPYFTSYTNSEYSSDEKIKVDSVKILPEEKWLGIYVNEGFSTQPFRSDLVKKIYADFIVELDDLHGRDVLDKDVIVESLIHF